MRCYTLGYIFNPTFERVVLITKNRPDWQRGKLNGVGGKIEEGESPIDCIVREVREEAALETKESDWAHICIMKGPDWNVDVFAMIHAGPESDVRTLTDEAIAWFDVDAIPQNRLTNIAWHIELAKDRLKNDQQIEEAVITYFT